MRRHGAEPVSDDLEQLSPGGTFEQIRNDDFEDGEDDRHEKKMIFSGTKDYWADMIVTNYRRM